jgi:hypothetical protein
VTPLKVPGLPGSPDDIDESMMKLALAAWFMHGLLSNTGNGDGAIVDRAFQIADAFIKRMKAEP